MEHVFKPVIWKLPDDFDTRANFDRCLRRLDMTSSPGYPYQREAPTNGQWLKWNGVETDYIQTERLWHDTQLVIAGKWESIIKVFIKQEPHKRSKFESKRWRLIMAGSLPVQMAWHMCFSVLNDLEISEAHFIPSKQGIKFVSGDWKRFLNQCENLGLSCGLDKSSWDWTAPYWTLRLDLEFRLRLARGKRLDDWYVLASSLYDGMFKDPTLMLSDGRLFKQVVPGVMKSGCVNTISTNSHCQMFIHLAMCIENDLPLHPIPFACGDDTLQHPVHTEDISLYSKYGVVIKEVSETREFMGHTITDRGPIPNYMMKHISSFEHTDDDNLYQFLDSMARMYVHTDYYEFWEALVRAMGEELPLSRAAYLYWYDFSA